MNNHFILLYLILFSSIFTFIFVCNFYLKMLLSIELMMMMLLLMMSLMNISFTKEVSMIFLYLSMMIMEGIFGLSLLFSCSSSYGKSESMMLI